MKPIYNFDGQIHTKGYHGTNFPRANAHQALLSEEQLRAIRLVNWAAECHVHRLRTGMRLGPLPHTVAEVEAARAIVAELFGKPEACTDEGVRCWSRW